MDSELKTASPKQSLIPRHDQDAFGAAMNLPEPNKTDVLSLLNQTIHDFWEKKRKVHILMLLLNSEGTNVTQ